MPVHQSHLVLVLEVAHSAQTANEQRCPDLPREVDEQPAEGADLDPRLATDRRTYELDALLDREERRLAGVDGDRDNKPIDELQAAVHEILVPPGDGVEAPGVDGDSRVGHAGKVIGGRSAGS
jgi:hypothetical protein